VHARALSFDGLGCLVHPDLPGDWADLFVVEGMACQFEGQLDLAVMIAFVPDHVLQVIERVIVVELHLFTRLDLAFDCTADDSCAPVKFRGEFIDVSVVEPFAWRERVVGFGDVFGEKDEAHVEHVHEHLADAGAAGHDTGLRAWRWDGAQEIHYDSIVAIPGVEGDVEDRVVAGV
jgi:hypothetical protein